MHAPPLSTHQALQQLLHERYEDYLSKAGGRGGPAEQLARDAVVAAFRHAQRVNAHALLAGAARGCGQPRALCARRAPSLQQGEGARAAACAAAHTVAAAVSCGCCCCRAVTRTPLVAHPGAQQAAAQGWLQAVEVALTKTYPLLNTTTCRGAGPELLHTMLHGLLGLVRSLAAQQAAGLAECLAGCCRVLLGKLQELASSSLSLGLPGDPLSQVRVHCWGRCDRCSTFVAR